MDFNIKKYGEFNSEQWNDMVLKIPASAIGHTWEYIHYQSCFQNVLENKSFICFDEQENPLAICPVIISEDEDKNLEISSNGAPVFAPALNDLKPSHRRKINDKIFNIIYALAKEHNIYSGKFLWHPLNGTCDKNRLAGKYAFELLKFNMLPQVNNTLVVDLENDENILTDNLSKYHRRNIRRAKKQNIIVEVIDSKSSTDNEIEEAMAKAQSIHFLAAGFATRPQATWNLMTDLVKKGMASLFLGVLNNEVISFLHCGAFQKMALGWSQANKEKYEKDYYVRHLVEWEAILYYKRNGFSFYELGERYFGPQLFHNPTDKEKSISQFKQNYGGELMPKITWKMYFNDDYMCSDLKNKIASFELNYHKTQKNFINSLENNL